MESLNQDVWRGDGPYYWRHVFSDYGDDYKLVKYPDGSIHRMGGSTELITHLIDSANAWRKLKDK